MSRRVDGDDRLERQSRAWQIEVDVHWTDQQQKRNRMSGGESSKGCGPTQADYGDPILIGAQDDSRGCIDCV